MPSYGVVRRQQTRFLTKESQVDDYKLSTKTKSRFLSEISKQIVRAWGSVSSQAGEPTTSWEVMIQVGHDTDAQRAEALKSRLEGHDRHGGPCNNVTVTRSRVTLSGTQENLYYSSMTRP